MDDNSKKIVNSVTILPRRDTLENWNKKNPIPKLDELCCVLTKRGKCKWKLGDGVTPFNKLNYIHKMPSRIICYDSTIEASGSGVTNKYIKNTIVNFNPFEVDKK